MYIQHATRHDIALCVFCFGCACMYDFVLGKLLQMKVNRLETFRNGL